MNCSAKFKKGEQYVNVMGHGLYVDFGENGTLEMERPWDLMAAKRGNSARRTFCVFAKNG